MLRLFVLIDCVLRFKIKHTSLVIRYKLFSIWNDFIKNRMCKAGKYKKYAYAALVLCVRKSHFDCMILRENTKLFLINF